MNIGESLNQEQILGQYKAAADLVAKNQKQIAQQQGGVNTFGEQLQSKIAQREISPEARKREKETISSIFGVPASMEAELKSSRLLPSEIGSLVSGRMNTYLDELNNIRESRKDRQTRIDEIVSNASTAVKSEAEKAKTNLSALQDTRDEYWKQYTEATRQIEHQQSLARAGTQTDRDRSVKNEMISKFNNILAEEAKNPDWDGGFNPDKYLELLNETENKLGTDGREWFLERFSPANVIVSRDNNFQTLEQGGVNMKNIASKMTEKQLRVELTDDLGKANSEDDFKKIRDFYGDLADMDGFSTSAMSYQSLFRRYLINKFGNTEGERIFESLFSMQTNITTEEE